MQGKSKRSGQSQRLCLQRPKMLTPAVTHSIGRCSTDKALQTGWTGQGERLAGTLAMYPSQLQWVGSTIKMGGYER